MDNDTDRLQKSVYIHTFVLTMVESGPFQRIPVPFHSNPAEWMHFCRNLQGIKKYSFVITIVCMSVFFTIYSSFYVFYMVLRIFMAIDSVFVVATWCYSMVLIKTWISSHGFGFDPWYLVSITGHVVMLQWIFSMIILLDSLCQLHHVSQTSF